MEIFDLMMGDREMKVFGIVGSVVLLFENEKTMQNMGAVIAHSWLNTKSVMNFKVWFAALVATGLAFRVHFVTVGENRLYKHETKEQLK